MAVGNGYQTGAADPGFYQNQLKNLISNPGSFSGTPGYQFAFDQAMQGVNRANSAMRGSGNVLAALQDRASGLASQNFSDYAHLLGGLSGQEQQYDLGLAGANNTAQSNTNQFALGNEANAINRLRAGNDFTLGSQRNANDLTLGLGQNANAAQRNANDLLLGQGQNANAAQRNANDLLLGQGQNANMAQRNQFDYQLGLGQNANAAQRNSNDFGLGMFNASNNFALGQEQNANNAQRNWWDYSLGNQQNTNQYNLGMYNAETNRAAQQSNAFNQGQNTLLDWTRLGYQLNPAQRIAGVPGANGGGWLGVG